MTKNRSKPWYAREEIKKDIYKHLPTLRRVILAGGEPLLIPEHYEFLDECIERKEAHHIELHYHTNGTVLKTKLFDKWRHFESIRIFFSLDDIGERNHYIRYPSSWEKIKQNLEIIDEQSPDNVDYMILCTVQIKNIFYLDELISFFAKKKLKKIRTGTELVWTEPVRTPYFLSCQLLPVEVKSIITKKLNYIQKRFPEGTKRIKGIIDFMNERDQSDLLYIFYDYIQSLDHSRGTSFQEIFPELSELLMPKSTFKKHSAHLFQGEGNLALW